MSEVIPLVTLYGEGCFEIIDKEIKTLAKNSNLKFDEEYLRLGISFMNIHSMNILEGKEKKVALSNLVSISFGKAAIAKFNK